MPDFQVKFVKLQSNAQTPTQAKEGDAGYDLYAVEGVTLAPLERKIVKTGIAVEIPRGYYGRIAPRSGLAAKNGIDVMAGVIDCSYRGEVGVILINLNPTQFILDPQQQAFSRLFGPADSFKIKEGDKIAQIIIEKCHEVEFYQVDTLSSTSRGAAGFGSTK